MRPRLSDAQVARLWGLAVGGEVGPEAAPEGPPGRESAAESAPQTNASALRRAGWALFAIAVAGLWSGERSIGSFREGLVRAVPARWLVPGGDGGGMPVSHGDVPVKYLKDPRAWSVASLLVLASPSLGQQAVEWKVSEGGNGHWYQVISEAGDWNSYNSACIARGGHLATIQDAAENAKVRSLSASGRLFLGGYQLDPNGPSEPAEGWVWVTGESWQYSPWAPGEPNNASNLQHWLVMLDGTGLWDDGHVQSSMVQAYVCEWEADCNGDGIVDYGQILRGGLSDSNSNDVPDCCEDGTCTRSLVVNPSFESGSPLNACATESVSAANLIASGWQVSAGTVDRVRAGSSCSTSTRSVFGYYCVDLCGTPASSGAIMQLVPTVPGHKYRCTFWLSGDASDGPAIKKVHAKVGTYVDLSYTFTCSGTGAQSWVSNQFDFTARGANEPLEFVADNGVTTGGPMLDAISLIDISTQCVGDLDGDADVNGADMALLLLNWGPCQTSP